ncbi:hypothetical protein [Mycolicibacterium sp. P9-22]|uniref:hypothetical protein n=1 Tax=Mycolicibacterium sp. P9-22 TaxID=2024613 RepID=UPI0011ED7CA1|nr:hypothetical protein [Mycolicibacterium sp. P9-22]
MGENGRVAVLLAAALALTACFFVAPAVLAGGDFGPLTDGHLVEAAFRAELVASWQSADQAMTQGLIHLIAYWRRYHAIKIVIATALLAVLVLLGVSGRRRPRGLLYALGALALFALMLVMVNIQATAAPLTALLQALPTPDSAATAGIYGQIGQALADRRSVPVLDAVIDSFGEYHAVMAVQTAVVAAGFVACSVWAWRGGRPERLTGAVAAVLAVGLVVATVASARLSLDAAEALQPYFSGVER